ncbi:hypothetical protein IC1_05966 [Bacillus cereus VD022]|uniref:Uncharacterized protein n=1 Tax=Bacillus cereus TIAC219 TaxID=718222 RepID=A0ABC9SPU3_BACCE|nr:hypothetical protein IC1_05966 [Bacillus cereus VD022]EOQ57451.1 hypothetical protein IAY_06436 [Bacillus cereus TIAC219]
MTQALCLYFVLFPLFGGWAKTLVYGTDLNKYWGTAEICLNIGHRITYISLHMHSSNTKKRTVLLA